MAKGRSIVLDRMIQVQCRPHRGDQRWRAALPVYPGEPHGSCTVIIDGREITVVFGWHDGQPLLWRSEGVELVTGDRSGRLVDGHQLAVLANLAEGPIELDGPKARWRWRVVT